MVKSYLLERREGISGHAAVKHKLTDQQMDILIVDDSLLVTSKIKELIEDVKVVTGIKSCGTYAEAIDLLKNDHPKVVLLDINLPDRSGIDLLQHIKTFWANIIVVMVTNQSSEYYQNLCFKMGADYFLDKSKDFDQLPSILYSLA